MFKPRGLCSPSQTKTVGTLFFYLLTYRFKWGGNVFKNKPGAGFIDRRVLEITFFPTVDTEKLSLFIIIVVFIKHFYQITFSLIILPFPWQKYWKCNLSYEYNTEKTEVECHK